MTLNEGWAFKVDDTSRSLPISAGVGVTLNPANSEPASFNNIIAASEVLNPTNPL